MNVVRLTSPMEVIKYWDLFREGLQHIVKLAHERTTPDEYCKMLVNLAARPNEAWIGVVMEGGPLSYGIAIDSTPPHSSRRTFSVISFYAIPGRPDATQSLMDAFERWARSEGVDSYVVTTRRDTGAAIKCFRSGRYGFKKTYTAFEKTL
jgi:hypothetical protein